MASIFDRVILPDFSYVKGDELELSNRLKSIVYKIEQEELYWFSLRCTPKRKRILKAYWELKLYLNILRNALYDKSSVQERKKLIMFTMVKNGYNKLSSVLNTVVHRYDKENQNEPNILRDELEECLRDLAMYACKKETAK